MEEKIFRLSIVARRSYTLWMKPLLSLALTILVSIILYLALPERGDDSEKTSESPAVEQERPEAPSPEIQVSLDPEPSVVIPGEPARILMRGVASPSDVKSFTFDGKPVPVFSGKGAIAALVGIDFHKKPGSYPLILTLGDGRMFKGNLEVKPRVMATAEFDIPEQLGGNTPQAEHELTTTLSTDSSVLNSVTEKVTPERLWSTRFRFPLEGDPVITDTYGYSRKTGSVSLSHLGTDFRAAEGTPVHAINSGKVAYTGTLRNFGKTVVIDHGLGVMSVYMHLSDIKARENENVKKGDVIAKSGSTGYALGPHLHLSVRIDGLSIDPQKFYELMGGNE